MSDAMSEIYKYKSSFEDLAIDKYGHYSFEEALREDERLLQVIENLNLELQSLQDKIRLTKKHFNQIRAVLRNKESKPK